MKKDILFISLLLIITSSLLITTIYFLYRDSRPIMTPEFDVVIINDKTIDIIFDDLDYNERKVVVGWLEDLKPIYFDLINKIIFTKNRSIIHEAYGDEITNNIAGLNVNNGEVIYIYYDDFYDWRREVLCHELLHSIIKLEESLEEQFVGDIDKYGVCYEYNKRVE